MEITDAVSLWDVTGTSSDDETQSNSSRVFPLGGRQWTAEKEMAGLALKRPVVFLLVTIKK